MKRIRQFSIEKSNSSKTPFKCQNKPKRKLNENNQKVKKEKRPKFISRIENVDSILGNLICRRTQRKLFISPGITFDWKGLFRECKVFFFRFWTFHNLRPIQLISGDEKIYPERFLQSFLVARLFSRAPILGELQRWKGTVKGFVWQALPNNLEESRQEIPNLKLGERDNV